jgi:hypothetical protein
MFKYDTGGAFGRSPDPEALAPTTDLEGYYIKAGYMLPGKVGPRPAAALRRGTRRLDYGVTTGTAQYFDNTLEQRRRPLLHRRPAPQAHRRARRTSSYDTPHPVIRRRLRDYRQATLGLQFIF